MMLGSSVAPVGITLLLPLIPVVVLGVLLAWLLSVRLLRLIGRMRRLLFIRSIVLIVLAPIRCLSRLVVRWEILPVLLGTILIMLEMTMPMSPLSLRRMSWLLLLVRLCPLMRIGMCRCFLVRIFRTNLQVRRSSAGCSTAPKAGLLMSTGFDGESDAVPACLTRE